MKAEVIFNHDGYPLSVELANGQVIKLISYETRDSIICDMLELITSEISKVYNIDSYELEENIYTNEMMYRFDDLFEPYATGWQNYN